MLGTQAQVPAGDIAGIKADTALIKAETEKIDNATSDGLSGVDGSLSYSLKEAERHIHNRARWWGKVGGADETNAIAAGVDNPFVAVSGANAYGAAIPICGSADSPVPTGSGEVKFDFHKLLVTDLDSDTTPWLIRIIWGNGTSAAALGAEQYSEVMAMTNAVPGNRAGASPVEIIMPRIAVGSKVWAQVWNDTNLAEASFFWGCHGYAG